MVFVRPSRPLLRRAAVGAAVAVTGSLIFAAIAAGPAALGALLTSVPWVGAEVGLGFGLILTALAEHYANPKDYWDLPPFLLGMVGWLGAAGAIIAAAAGPGSLLLLVLVPGPLGAFIAQGGCQVLVGHLGERRPEGLRGDGARILRRVAAVPALICAATLIPEFASLITHIGAWAMPALATSTALTAALAAVPFARSRILAARGTTLA